MRMKMKGFCLGLGLMTSVSLWAQTEQNVALKEVVIEASRIENKSDGLIIYPTQAQKRSSRTGYAMLQQMNLPNIRVDELTHSISTVDNKGGVQVRINGIIVDKPELLSLDPKTIRKIDFIDNPGVRYGDGIAYVINILTRRAESGYAMGTELMHALTTKDGDAMLFGKWNKKQSELSLNYDFGYLDYTGNRMREWADYRLNDGSIYRIERNDFASRSKSLGHNLKLTYNLADDSTYVFQASLNGSFRKTPVHYNRKHITDGTNQYDATDADHGKNGSPVLDVYYFRNLSQKQSLTLNAVGTYINTSSSESYDEGGLYEYDVDGKTYSFMTEGVYENRLKPFVFSAGINYMQKYTKNEYVGSVVSLNKIRNNRLYIFSDIRGNWRKFSYTAGLGVSYLHYQQDDHDYDYWTVCPKASLAYNFTKEWQLSYQVNSNERVSRITMISDAVIRTNTMEWTVGNPDLKPNREWENTLRLSYNNNRLQSFVMGYFKKCNRPNMAHYERTEDDRFIYTQRNQKEIDVLNVMGYANYWVIPQKLSLAASGGLFRCFNYGDDYTHCYTSYNVTGSVNAYLGDFTISAYADNGFRFLEGETKGYNGAQSMLKVAYNYKDWQFGLTWKQPFRKNYKMFESELLNQNIQKESVMYSSDNANFVGLTVSWRLSKGKKYRTARKTIQLKDTDTGILK